MSDVSFINRSSVRWVDSFDTYFINSDVNTDAGAELSFGTSEVLAGTSTSSIDVQALLTLGIVEFVASTIPTSSVSGIVLLEIGKLEGLAAAGAGSGGDPLNIAQSKVDAFITFGVAEGISGTAIVQSNVDVLLTIGIIELVSSTIIYTSAITGEPFYGTTYYMLGDPSANSVVSDAQLVIGTPEQLSATSSIEPIVSGFVILGGTEIIFGNTLVTTESDSSLTLGIGEDLSSTTNINSFGVGLITIGINELLSSTTISISVAPDVGIDLGIDEELTSSHLANSIVYTAELSLGEPEPLSSSIHIQSDVANLFSVGIVEILASTLPIDSTITDSSLDIGGDEALAAASAGGGGGPGEYNGALSSISAFLTFGITEPLSGSLHAQSAIRKGGTWSELTIGHIELLGHTSNVLSIVSHTTLDIGIVEELEHNTLISSNVDSELLIGLTEFLSSVIISTSSTPLADLTLGQDEPLSSSIDIETASSAFILMGTTEQLSATSNIEVIQNSVLTIGFIELLSSTVLSLTITDAEVEIGGSEIQTGTGSAVSNTYAVLTLGEAVDLSGSLHIQSDIDVIFSFGIMEMMSVALFHVSVVESNLEIGEDTVLTSTPLIQSDSLAILQLGITEDLSVTNNIISVTAVVSLFIGGGTEDLRHTIILPGYVFPGDSNFDPPDHFAVSSTIDINLTTGDSEQLTGNISFNSDVANVVLTIGAIEVLLSTSSVISTSSAGILTTGISELLSSTTVSNSVADAVLTIGDNELLSATTNVETHISGILTLGYTEILSSNIEVISFIRKGGEYSQLTLGIIEVLEHTSITHSNVQDTSLIIGIDESLSSTYYILGNTQVDALLTTGKVEVLGSSSIIQSVTTTDLTIGTDEELSGTSNATIEGGTITGVLTLGVDESLSSTIDIVSDVNTDIITGVLELMSSTVITVSDVVLDLILGVDEPFVSGCVVSSNVTVFLTMGIAEQLDSSIDIVSVITTDVYLGLDEQLTHTTDVTTDVNLPELIIGINEILSSHPYIQPIVTANLGLGILEVLGATSISQANLPGELTLGVDELLEVSELVQSYVFADLELGAATPLSATINIISTDESLLTIGKTELLATSNFSISITDASLTLGVLEELSHLEYIHSNVEVELTLGVETPLTYTTVITSVVDNSELIVGVVELLASTSIATLSTPPASIGFGVDELVTGSTLIQSLVSLDPDMIIGIDELFSSTNVSTVSFPPGELTLGAAESLSAICNVQPNVADVLTLGGQENLSSTIVIGHLVLNTIDLVVGGPVPVTASIGIESNVTGTWLYVPGVLESLSSTLNCIVNIDPNLQTDNEILEATNNIISTAQGSELSVGVVEIASGTNFSISIVASTLDLGVGYILNSTNNIISNVVLADLTLGTFVFLRPHADFDVISIVNDTELIFGVVELVASSLFAISITDSEIVIGHTEELTTTAITEFELHGFLNIPGTLEVLSGNADVVSYASAEQLLVGSVEISGSSLFITSSVSDISIDIGSSEELTGRSFADSVVYAAKMTIGDESDLSATGIVVCNIISDLDKPLILDSTIDIISNVSADTLYFGEETDLSSTVNIISITDSNIVIGDVTELSGSIQTARTFAFANLTNPTIYLESNKYSLWNKIISDVRASYLDSNGIIEISANGWMDSDVAASELTLGLPDELSGTSFIESIINDAILYIGYTELVSSTNFTISITDADLISPVIYVSSDISIQSVVSDSRLTGPEHLYGSAFIQSDLTGNIVDGRVELVSAQDDVTTSVNVELTLGVVEDLSASIDITDNITIPEVIYNVPLESDEEYIWNKVQSNVKNAWLRVLVGYYTGFSVSRAKTSEAELTIGYTESLSATSNINSFAIADIYLGEIVELSSTIFAVSELNGSIVESDYFGKASSETESWATLTLGVAEHFESSSIFIQSVVENDGIVIGAVDFYGDNTISSNVDILLSVDYALKSSPLVQSVVNVELTIGGVTDLSHTIPDVFSNVSDTELDFGVVEQLSHGGFLIESFVDGFIYVGVEYGIRTDAHIQSVVNDAELFIGDQSSLFSQVHAQSLIITPYMFRGTIEEVSATNVIVVSDTEVNLLIGAVELLSSTIASHSVTDADLFIGIDTGLTGTGSSNTNSSGHMLLGITEILTSMVDITSIIGLSDNLYNDIAIDATTSYDSIIPVSELVVGSQEYMSAASNSISTAVGEYATGRPEHLSGDINFSTNAITSIDIGYAERLSGTIVFSINIYDLEFLGIVEECSSSITIDSRVDTFLNLGVSESLSTDLVHAISITVPDLVIGSVEELTSTSGPWVESNSDTLWLEIEFNELVAVQSYIPDVELFMGEDVIFTGTITIGNNVTIDPMYLGEDEILSASAVSQVVVATYLSLGVINEYISGTVELSSNVYGSSLTVYDTGSHARRISADLQYWYDHFVVQHQSLNKYQLPFPASDKVYEQSFIELLFNEEYDSDSYRYMYRQVNDRISWPVAIKTRKLLNPDTANYFIADGDSKDDSDYNINLYGLRNHDLIMLDRLLVYRLEPENSTLVGIDYDSLETTLSKMIYIYLELQLTGDYSKYDNDVVFANGVSPLETCYETYLTQNIFKHVSEKGT